MSVAAENARASRPVYPMASFPGVPIIASRLLEHLLSEGRCACRPHPGFLPPSPLLLLSSSSSAVVPSENPFRDVTRVETHVKRI